MPNPICNDSNNTTVPGMLAKYTDVFKEEDLTTSKWSWACGVILSRGFFFVMLFNVDFFFVVVSFCLKFPDFFKEEDLKTSKW